MKIESFNNEKHIKQDYELYSYSNLKECFELPKLLPDISKIINMVVEYEVLNMRTIHSVAGLSFEGYYLSGKKMVIELKLKQKILYISTIDPQSIHMAENETFQCVYIVIPSMIDGTEPEFLIDHKYLKPELKIEETACEKIDKRTIYIFASIFAKLFILPTYQLSYSLHKNCKSSTIYLTNEKGTKNSIIQFNQKCKCIKPKWSPKGYEIAFLSNHEGKFVIYIHSIKSGITQRVIDVDLINTISSFDWASDGNRIFFTSSKDGCKEIFSIEISSQSFQQVTRGKGLYSSFGPKCSLDAENIVFLRSISGLADLWICSTDGRNLRKVTSCGFVKCFDWFSNGNFITFIKGNDGQADELHIVDVTNFSNKKIEIADSIINIKSVCTSKDCQHIAFIGSDLFTENIFIYDLENEEITNLTNHQSGVAIGDYDWKADSSCVCYSSNESFYFNIYAIHLKTKFKKQLTNSTYENIEIAYRPRIS